MASFDITMLSIVLAFIGYFQPGPLAAMQPAYGVPQRFQEGLHKDYVLRSLGVIVDKVWPITHGNATAMHTSSIPDTVTVPTPIETDPVSETDTVVDELSDSPEDTAEYTASDGYAVMVNDEDEQDTYLPRTITQLLGRISRIIGLASLLPPYPVFTKCLIQAIVLLGLPAFLVVVLFVVFNFWRDLPAADAEIMGFADEIQTKRVSLLHRIDLATLIVDRELDDIALHIQTKRERVRDELDSFHPNDSIDLEMNAFREKLESRLQEKLDRQVSWVRDFMHNVEQARQGIPDPAEIWAQCEKFEKTLQRSKDARAYLEDALEQSRTALDLIKEKHNKLSSASRGTTSSTEELCSTCPTSNDEATSHDNGKTRYQDDAYGILKSKRKNEEGQSKLVAQWVMASDRKEMTPEEFEKARKLRRERVEMRHGSRNESHCQVPLQSPQNVQNVGGQQPDLWAGLDSW